MTWRRGDVRRRPESPICLRIALAVETITETEYQYLQPSGASALSGDNTEQSGSPRV
jgi:hypothetical protein